LESIRLNQYIFHLPTCIEYTTTKRARNSIEAILTHVRKKDVMLICQTRIIRSKFVDNPMRLRTCRAFGLPVLQAAVRYQYQSVGQVIQLSLTVVGGMNDRT
jgi:hypothetical protein